MFEKEVMISSLKKHNMTLSKLVEELEESSKPNDYDRRYCEETLKRIESALRKIRKMNGSQPNCADFTYEYAHSSSTFAW